MQGNYRIFTLQRAPETNLAILQAKLVKGTRGEVKFLISRKNCCTQFYRLLEYKVNDGKNPQLSKEQNSVPSSDKPTLSSEFHNSSSNFQIDSPFKIFAKLFLN